MNITYMKERRKCNVLRTYEKVMKDRASSGTRKLIEGGQ